MNQIDMKGRVAGSAVLLDCTLKRGFASRSVTGPDGRFNTSDDGPNFQAFNLNPANLALPVVPLWLAWGLASPRPFDQWGMSAMTVMLVLVVIAQRDRDEPRRATR